MRRLALARQDAQDDLAQLRLRGGGRGENFGNADRLEMIGQANVGHDRQAEHAHSAMNRGQHFRHGRHANHVGPNEPQEAVFGPRFQVRAGHCDIYAPVGSEVFAGQSRAAR